MRDSTYTPTLPIAVTRKKLVIPPFSYAVVWGGVSTMLTRFSIGNVNNFTFKRPIEQPNETFIAAVSWSESPYVYRYKLTENIGELLYFPVLDNQQIGSNAYLEVWSVAGEALAYNLTDWELTVSKLILPDLCTCLEGSESETLTALSGEVLPAYQFCNPFCVPLCS